jgi:hypothetical protein
MQAQEGVAQSLDAADSCEGMMNRRRCSRARERGVQRCVTERARARVCCAGGGGNWGSRVQILAVVLHWGVCGVRGSEHQRATTAPNTAQRIGSCFATDQADRKLLK